MMHNLQHMFSGEFLHFPKNAVNFPWKIFFC